MTDLRTLTRRALRSAVHSLREYTRDMARRMTEDAAALSARSRPAAETADLRARMDAIIEEYRGDKVADVVAAAGREIEAARKPAIIEYADLVKRLEENAALKQYQYTKAPALLREAAAAIADLSRRVDFWRSVVRDARNKGGNWGQQARWELPDPDAQPPVLSPASGAEDKTDE